MFESLLEAVRTHDRIILHRHLNPDGDAIGSQVGLKHILLENFPGKEVYAVGDEPKRYAFMEDSAPDVIPDATYDGALAIVLDTASSALVSDTRYQTAAATARIDHHLFCEKITDIEVIDSSYESCCGLVTAFAMECGLRLSPLAAKSLYTGMVTDSGRFRYDSTTAQTFRRAAFLMEQPFETADIYRNLYADDLTFMKLRAQFILKIQTTPNGVAFLYTTKEEAATLPLDTFGISRGMVNTMSDIRGIEIWANFTETDEGVLCELRSSQYNVNRIAVAHGGGGHIKASGATLRDRAEAMQLLDELNHLTEADHE